MKHLRRKPSAKWKRKSNVAGGLVFLVPGGEYFDFAKREIYCSFFDVHICEAACSVYLSCIVKKASLERD